MAASFIRSDKNSAAAASTSITPGANYAAGNTAIVLVGYHTSGDSDPLHYTVSDSVNGSYAQDAITLNINDAAIAIFSKNLTSQLPTTGSISVTGGTGVSAIAAIAMVFSGLLTSSFLDKTATNPSAASTASPSSSAQSPTSTFPSGTTATTTQASELVIGGVMMKASALQTMTTGGSSVTWNAESTGVAASASPAGNGVFLWAQYAIVSSIGTFISQPTDGTNNFRAVIATYKAAAVTIPNKITQIKQAINRASTY